jgi:hypothetical protein
MRNIVERLRDRILFASELAAEAADEIEHLQRDIVVKARILTAQSKEIERMTELEKLVKEWRDAQKAIDNMTPEQRQKDIAPLDRLMQAHYALNEYADEHLS